MYFPSCTSLFTEVSDSYWQLVRKRQIWTCSKHMVIECALEWWSAEEEAPKERSSKEKGLGGTEVTSLCENQRIDRKEWTWAWSNAFLEQANPVLKERCSERKMACICVNRAEGEHDASKETVTLVVGSTLLTLDRNKSSPKRQS